MARLKKPRGALVCKTSSKDKGNGSMDLFYLEFDGASKGNPGKAGAGALLRSPDGSVICELTKGVGVATCNAAEYTALLMGLQAALDQGIFHIRAQGDSKLVCNQVMGEWKVHSQNLATLFSDVMDLVKRFQYFSIHHVYRDKNSAADALANAAVELPEAKLVTSHKTQAYIKVTPSVDECHVKMKEHVSRNIAASRHEVAADPEIPGNVFCQRLDVERAKCYWLEYDGASQGNPGKAGVGVLLRQPDGSVQLELREGLGTATRNAAHYQALVIGLRTALDRGISHINVLGDSDLVFKQMMGKSKVKSEDLRALWKEANDLRRRFEKCSISKIDKDHNTAAHHLAESAIQLSEAYSNPYAVSTSYGMSSKSSTLAQRQQSIMLDSTRMKQLVGSMKTVSNAVLVNRSFQAHSSCKVMPLSSYNNQACAIRRIMTPRPRSLPFSVAISKCSGIALFAATESLARVVRCRL